MMRFITTFFLLAFCLVLQGCDSFDPMRAICRTLSERQRNEDERTVAPISSTQDSDYCDEYLRQRRSSSDSSTTSSSDSSTLP